MPAILPQPSPLPAAELAAPLCFITLPLMFTAALLGIRLFRPKIKVRLVCTVQVTEPRTLLLSTSLMVNNQARGKPPSVSSRTTLSSRNILFTYLLIADCSGQTPASLQPEH